MSACVFGLFCCCCYSGYFEVFGSFLHLCVGGVFVCVCVGYLSFGGDNCFCQEKEMSFDILGNFVI